MKYKLFINIFRAAIIFRHPTRHELSNSFLEPFAKQVWILTLIIGILNWALLYLTIRAEKKYNSDESNIVLYQQPESETFLITSAAICQQGRSGISFNVDIFIFNVPKIFVDKIF